MRCEALDFQFVTTAGGRLAKQVNVLDEFTRECRPSSSAAPSRRRHLATLHRLALKGAPGHVRFDNGPEFIAAAVADWCRSNGVGTVILGPRLTVAERRIESFNGRLRNEFLNA